MLYLKSITTLAMSTTLDQILHHQRILVTGNRSSEIIDACCKVLDHYDRHYDLLTKNKISINDGPIVFIEATDDLVNYDPHIALIDDVVAANKNVYEALANGMPKSGTLVYNEQDMMSKEICTSERKDVHLEPYSSSNVKDVAMTLLKRVGISEESFKSAIN